MTGAAGEHRRSRLPAVLWLLVGLTLSRDASAQTFLAQAGSSTLARANGGSLRMRGRTYDATIGAGDVLGHFRIGALLRTTVRGYTFSFGDDVVEFELPTDTVGGRHYIVARGAGLKLGSNGQHAFALVGTTSTSYGTPFFKGADWGDGIALLFLDKQLSSRLRAFTRNVLTRRQTSIHGLEWSARRGLKMATMGGIGADSGYFAGSVQLDKQWLVTNATYVVTGPQFRRVVVGTPSSAESDRENVSITLRPSPAWMITAARQNLLQPVGGTQRATRVSVNQVGGSLNAVGFRLNAGLFDAHSPRRDSLGTSLGIGRSLTQAADMTISYYRSGTNAEPRSDSLVGTLRETIGPRFALVQMMTRSAGQTSMKFGGSFLSNPITAEIDYQTVYAPFRAPNPFVQALSLNLRIVVRDVQVQVATYTLPDGRTRYTVSGSQSLYRSGGGGASARSTSKFAKYLIRGRVVDETGRPLAGAALRINHEVVLTNDDGQFFLRTKKAGACRLEVITEEFLQPGYFKVTDAPHTVIPEVDDRAGEVTISVRHVAAPTI
jgi:hypothetical protein